MITFSALDVGSYLIIDLSHMLTNGIISDPWSRTSNIEQIVQDKHNNSDFASDVFLFSFFHLKCGQRVRQALHLLQRDNSHR